MLHIRSNLSSRRSEHYQMSEANWSASYSENMTKEKRTKISNRRSGRFTIRIIMLLGLLLVGCEKEVYNAPGDQPLFFEYHYINHAWGFQESGWLIDRDGNIKSFNMPEDYRIGLTGGHLSLEDLEHNLGLTDSIVGNVADGELEKYINYIPAAAEGEIGRSNSIAADAGSSVLSCYLWDPEKSAYQYVFLAQSGDWEQFNLSEEAEKLVEWLLDFDVFWLSD